VTDFTDDSGAAAYRLVVETPEEGEMAQKRTKKSKDLDPKSRAKKVRGGNLPDDERNINRSVNQIKNPVVRQVQNLGPTTSKTVQNAVRGV